MTLDDFLEKLEGVRRGGTGYVAICPAHDDREASLGITESDDKLLVRCHAGCATADVLGALGLEFSDLFADGGPTASREPEAVYDYTDEHGNVLFQSIRFPGKKFRQRHQGADGEWTYNLDGVRRVLYRLPDVIAAVSVGLTVYIVEGEKDAEAIIAAGKAATCNPMGAGKWREEYNEFFRDANVVIVADRDDPGRAHAETVKTNLLPVARNVWVVQAKTGKDAYDHLVLHKHKVEEFVQVRQPVRRGVITARELADQALEDLELREGDLPGFILVDAVPLKFRLGRVYAAGAYTGDGKTTWAVQGTRKLCSESKRGTYFTLEMPERDLRNKLLVHRGIPLSLLEEPWRLRMNPAMYQAYLDGIEEIGSWNLDIVFDGDMTSKKAAEIVRDRESEFVVIDHIHRMGATSDRAKLEEQIRGYTNMALEQNVMVLLLCQLREPRMHGKDMPMYPIPTLQSFRETGVIGQEASIAFSIWRQRDQVGISYTGATQVTVLKNRHTTGHQDAAGRIFFPMFDPDRQMFLEAPAAQIIQHEGATHGAL